MTSAQSGTQNDHVLPAGPRTLVNFLLVVHLFFLAVCLSANYAPSRLQFTILTKFRPYTRLLNFDLNFTPYYLTHAGESDVDHRIEVLPAEADETRADAWIVLPSGGFRGSEAYKRYQRLGFIWALQAQTDGEPALFAQAIGTHFARQQGIKPKQIRCRRHFLQSMEDIRGGTAARRNPNDPSFFAVVYAANAIVSENGYVEVVRIDEAGQVAQPRRNGARGATRNEPNR
jgi:hypothetical protein